MLEMCLLFMFFSAFSLVLGFMPINLDNRPRLKLQTMDLNAGQTAVKNQNVLQMFFGLLRNLSVIVKPLCAPALRHRVGRDLIKGKVNMSVEEFVLIKILMILILIWIATPVIKDPEVTVPMIFVCIVFGYLLPDWWLKGRVSKVQNALVRDLPDTVDLLALCVNAGLDFMMALKYLVEKSRPSFLIEELSIMLQEINVGKPRREALRSFARKYDLPDIHTFSRTLIQADRMGTSVTEALNILSEDMRETRLRRGEAMALKAPLKMLIPLLLFIFPVVAILVAGPIFIDFFTRNPMQGLTG